MKLSMATVRNGKCFISSGINVLRSYGECLLVMCLLLLFTACGGDDLDDAKPKEEIPADNTKNEETDEPSEPSFVIEPVTGYHHNLLNYWESDGGGGSISFHLFSFRMFS